MNTDDTLWLKPNREKPLLRHHPWIFSGAVARLEGDPGLGNTVEVRSARGDFLAYAAYSPHSQIRARVWTWDSHAFIGSDFFRARIQNSIARRKALFTGAPPEAHRLIYAESDGLPGLIVDRYSSTLVAQFLSAGAERWRDTIADLLLDLTNANQIYERSDVDVRKLEGLPSRAAPLRGDLPPELFQIKEDGLNYWIDVYNGHKTGFYLDQRPNRLRIRQLSAGKTVLNGFCYTGGFTLDTLAGGAESILSIDTSANALDLARKNLLLNNLPSEKVRWLEGDVFAELRTLRDKALSFDLIILDPPKFAPTASQVERAARGYKDINLLAFKLLRPGGMLVTFSCSGGVSPELFQKIVAGAALDAGVDARILERLSQSPDHPIALNFPESEYLKGLILSVD